MFVRHVYNGSKYYEKPERYLLGRCHQNVTLDTGETIITICMVTIITMQIVQIVIMQIVTTDSQTEPLLCPVIKLLYYKVHHDLCNKRRHEEYAHLIHQPAEVM